MSATSEGVTAVALRIFVNDQMREIAVETSLTELMRALGLVERKGIAAALNGAVVPRGEWQTRRLTAGDRVIVIQATQGG
jgi:sulfur carrier protein